jgi:hypothetical protein
MGPLHAQAQLCINDIWSEPSAPRGLLSGFGEVPGGLLVTIYLDMLSAQRPAFRGRHDLADLQRAEREVLSLIREETVRAGSERLA